MLNRIIRYIFTFSWICFTSFATASAAQNPKVPLILNMQDESKLPRNFRTTKDPLKTDESIPSTVGFFELNLSGSGQFSEKSLGFILERIKNPELFYVLDLRQESHGFINGSAVSWYGARDWANVGKTLNEIENEEKMLFSQLLAQKDIVLIRDLIKDPFGNRAPEGTHMPLRVNQIALEQQVVESSYKKNYKRIPVTDHLRPDDYSVDRFITFFNQLPKGHWLHIHCAAGVGRTTTFMAMYDIMVNSKKVNFDQIIKRQWIIGGSNLLKPRKKDSWKYFFTEEKARFLKQFYAYCRSNQDQFQTPWSLYLLLEKAPFKNELEIQK